MSTTFTPGIGGFPGVISPQEGVDSVILTSTGDYDFACERPAEDAAGGNLGLIAIDHALEDAGFDPEKISTIYRGKKRRPHLDTERTRIVEGMRALGAGEKGAVIGISTTTDEYFRFAPLAKLLRMAFPDATLIAGGAHFVRERIGGFADPVETALMMGLVDAVVVGHAQPFVDLVVKHGGRIEEVDAPGFYRLDPVSKRVTGRGKGKFPDLNKLTLLYDPVSMGIRTMLADGCRNGCNFCTVAGRPVALFDPEIVVRDLSAALLEHQDFRISLYDSNPLEPALRNFYRSVFLALDETNQSRKFAYIDPATLAHDFLESLNTISFGTIWSFNAGRDAVTEKQARAIGTRYKGKYKDQRMLDAEKKALIEFIDAMKMLKKLYPEEPPFGLMLSYIVTPFETRQSAMAMYEEMREFLALADKSIVFRFAVHALRPYPGTTLRNKYSSVIDMEEFNFRLDLGDRISPWKKGAAPALAFHRAVTMIPPVNDQTDYLKAFKRAINTHLPR